MNPIEWINNKIKSSFSGVHHNAKVFLLLHPLYVIPFTVFTNYEALYRQSIGLTREQLGFVMTVLMLVRGVASLIGGFVTDRLGRKTTTTLTDIVCWSVPTLIWAYSGNFTWILMGAVFNGFNSIASASFGCMFVEGTKPEKRVFIYSIFTMLAIMAGFFTPVGGWLVARFGMRTGGRIIYLAAFVSISSMIIIRQFMLRETEIGLNKMAQTEGHRFTETLGEYRAALGILFRSPIALATLFLFGVYMIQVYMLSGVCHPLYLTEYLGYSKAQYGNFPMISSIATLLTLLITIPLMQGKEKRGLAIGIVILVFGWWFISHYTRGSLSNVIIATAILGAGWAFLNPGLNSVWANAVRDDQRAKTQSIKDFMAALIAAPSGYIGARLYGIDPRFPYTFLVILFVLGIMLYGWAILYERNRHRIVSSHSVTSEGKI